MEPRKPTPDQIFEQALQLTDPEKRAAYLKVAVRNDDQLLRRVEALLLAHEEAGEFLKESPAGVSAKTLWVSSSAMGVVTEKSGDRIGPYKLLEQIGEGGCGVVYVAEQEKPVRRRVALKVIKLGMDTRQVVARFEAERQALALMDHPNIAKVLEAGATEAGRPYFVMELVKGIPVTRYCDENKLGTHDRLNLFAQICHAIQHAHQKGIIHRDIKPSNVLVADHDGVPVPKIIDFGIAKATTDQRLTDKTLYTAIEQFIGTPAYMSPEQARLSGLDIDTRSDIYSLGVLLYELLTGRTPFDAKRLIEAGLDEIRRIIREEDPPRPSTRLSTLDAAEQTAVAARRQSEPPKLLGIIRGDLDWIVMKTLEKDRNRRYETANGLAMDIRRFLANEPIQARPPGSLYRLQKFVRRNKLAFAAATAVTVALVFAVLVSVLWAVRATQAKVEISRLFNEAELARNEAGRQRESAEQERRRAQEALIQVEVQAAESSFKGGDAATALAYLAHALRKSPTNSVVANRIVWALTHRSFPLLVAEFDDVVAADLSPDGARIAIGSPGGVLQVMDIATGKLIVGPVQHDRPIGLVKFSPNGGKIVTVSQPLKVSPVPNLEPLSSYLDTPRIIQIWDAQSGLPIGAPLKKKDQINTANFSPDGERLIVACDDGTATIWNTTTGQVIGEPLRHSDRLRCSQFSPDGTRILTVGSDGSARVWDSSNNKLLMESIKRKSPLNSGQFSPDGKLVVVGGNDGIAQIWDVFSGRLIVETSPATGPVQDVCFSPDGTRIVTSSRDHTTRIWDAQTGRPLSEIMRHHDWVNKACFDPNGARLVTISRDGTARFWNVNTGEADSEPLTGLGFLRAAQFSQDGQLLLTVSLSKAQIWDVRPGNARNQLLKSSVSSGDSIHFSPNGKKIVADNFTRIQIWDLQSGLPSGKPIQRSFTPSEAGTSFSPVSAQFSPDSRFVIGISDEARTVQSWDASSGASVFTPIKHAQDVTAVEYSPEMTRVLTATGAGIARVWDSKTASPLTAPLLHDAVHGIEAAHFSPDGRRIVTVAGATLRLWNAITGALLAESITNATLFSEASFSPDGKLIVSASLDRTARLWSSEDLQPVGTPMRHNAFVKSARFNFDGSRIVTVAFDNTARVWDSRSGRPLTQPLQHTQGINSAEFSRDGRLVLTASQDKTIRVWDANTGQPLTDPLFNDAEAGSAEFSPNGIWALVATLGRGERLWDLPNLTQPIPPWLPEMAEAIAALRIGADGVFETVPLTQLLRLKSRFEPDVQLDQASRWAHWFFSDRSARTVSPSSQIGIQEYLSRRIEEGTFDGLIETLLLSPTNTSALDRMADLLFDQKKFHEAAAIRRRALAIRRNLLDDENLDVAQSLASLAYTLMAGGDFREAESAAREELAIREEKIPDGWQTFNARSLVGGCLLGQTNYAAAEPFLVSGYEGLKQREATLPDNVRLQEARERLIRLFTLTDRRDLTAKFQAEFDQSVRQASIKRHQRELQDLKTAAEKGDLQSLNNFAWFLATCADAECRNGSEAVTVAEKAVSETKRQNYMYLDTLAAAYAEAGEFPKAIRAQEEAITLVKFPKVKEELNSHLKLYQSNQPFHEERQP